MRVIPVLDVRGGVVVHGVAGQRHLYHPIVSQLTHSTAPRDVARAFREQLGLPELYLADLDALVEGVPNLALIAALAAETPTLWVDAGLRRAPEGVVLRKLGVAVIVAALETLDSPHTLRELAAMFGTQLVFSLDLRGGQLVTAGSGWPADPFAVAQQALACGVRRLLVLDVGRVGQRDGPGTEELCQRIRHVDPEVEITTGGGIKSIADLQRLRQCGVQGVLVATALHEGCLTRATLDSAGI